jgi:hypothetical protein
MLEQARTKRHADEYFSMVRLKLCCASLLRRSTSFNIRILKPRCPLTSKGLLFAISCKNNAARCEVIHHIKANIGV